jgi:hypothetical protein
MPDPIKQLSARLWLWITGEAGEGVTMYAILAILVALLGLLALSMLGVSNSLGAASNRI